MNSKPSPWNDEEKAEIALCWSRGKSTKCPRDGANLKVLDVTGDGSPGFSIIANCPLCSRDMNSDDVFDLIQQMAEDRHAETKRTRNKSHGQTLQGRPLFISHSSQDVDVAKALVALLKASLGLQSKDILCTSLSGHKLSGGASSDEALRSHTISAQAFIGLITPSSISSMYVIFELGARWGSRKPMIPLVARGVDKRSLKPPMGGLNALDAASAGDLHQMIAEIATDLNAKQSAPHEYQTELESLITIASKHASSNEDPQSPLSEGNESSVDQVLSDLQQQILVYAAKENGEIYNVDSEAGRFLRIGKRVMNKPRDRRQTALVYEAFGGLVKQSLIRLESGVLATLTAGGWKLADQIGDTEKGISVEGDKVSGTNGTWISLLHQQLADL